MSKIAIFFEFIEANSMSIFQLLVDHIGLTALAVAFAILIGIPLGIITSYFLPMKKPILGLANLVQAIPSIALLGIMIPIFGIGKLPAVIAVTVYSLLPIIKNTNTGLSNISPQINEVGKGIGLKPYQRLFRVQLPLALPFIMSGIRISAVTAVGLVTMAAYIGAGGLGQLVIDGISQMNMSSILAGAIPACILALFVDLTFSLIEKLIIPKGIAIKNNKLNFFEKMLVSINNAIKLRKLKKDKSRGIAINKNIEEMISSGITSNIENNEISKPTKIAKNKKSINSINKNKKPFSFARLRKTSQIVALGMIVLILSLVLILPPALQPKYDLSIGSKTSTEPNILNNIYAEYIEYKTGLNVDRKTGLGDTLQLYNAFEAKSIDMVLAYSGTVYSSVLKKELPSGLDPKARFEKIVKESREGIEEKYDAKGFDYLPFNNTYTLSVRKDFATKYNLKTISDLAKLSVEQNIKFGLTYMFCNREDGIKGVKNRYGINVDISSNSSQISKLDGAMRYSALMSNQVDVVDAYATDGLIVKNDLVVLEDNLHFFPEYNVIPFISKDTLNKFKDKNLECVNDLAKYITDKAIRELNFEVDSKGRPAKKVAREFLLNLGLIK